MTARIGGDEFAVLAIEAREDSEHILLTCLEETLMKFNAQSRLSFKLSLSCGATKFDTLKPCTLEELMASADQAMYQSKLSKQR
ncbi:MAG: diguanylate cyclase [Candidatus Omnitrophica bacterium]|nr:diguanylate cyclase [Candidatus Omnitrophota bacterium]